MLRLLASIAQGQQRVLSLLVPDGLPAEAM
jgi:hypothetical protein